MFSAVDVGFNESFSSISTHNFENQDRVYEKIVKK